MQRFVTVLVVAFLFAGSASAQSVAERLQKGIYTQDTVGDVEAALTTFREILKMPSIPRRYAAQAQARIVRCLAEKGDANAASREFTVLTRDYAEFRDVVASAATALRGRQGVQVVQLPSAPTPTTSSIRGRVTDDGGRPLRAAQVHLSGPGIEPRTVGSDGDGH